MIHPNDHIFMLITVNVNKFELKKKIKKQNGQIKYFSKWE